MDQNEFEKLISEGYTIDGSLALDVNDLTQLNVKTESINSTPREDKTVTVEGDITKRVSSMMFGYNKSQIILKDGNYVNADDLTAAIETAVTTVDSGKVIINTKGEKLTEEQIKKLIKIVNETAGLITIKGKNPNITNQDARNWGVISADGREKNKGALFLGNSGIILKDGKYVNLDEILTAINDYVIMSGPESIVIPPIIPENEEKIIDDIPKEPSPILSEVPIHKEEPKITSMSGKVIEDQKQKVKTTVRITRKYKNKAGIWLATLALSVGLLSSVKVADKTVNITQPLTQHSISYEMVDLEQQEEGIRKIIGNEIKNIEMGGMVEVKDGDILYETSLLNEKDSKTIGKEFSKENKGAGFYRITGFSLLSEDGKIITYIEDFKGELSAPKLGEYVNQVCSNKNIDINTVKSVVHLGNSRDNTRLGWIDVTKLINRNDISDDMIQSIAMEGCIYKNTIDNFTGDTVTLDNGSTIIIKDANGNLLSPGSSVIGSDGKEYVVNNLHLVSQTMNATTQIVDGKKLTFEIKDPALGLASLPLIAAFASTIATKKKNKEAEQHPEYYEFNNDEKYQKFLEEFKKSKENFEKKSSFTQMVKNIFYRKEFDILKQLSSEQIDMLYSTIREHVSLSNEDNINLSNGKVTIIRANGTIEDITETVMKYISSIGSENKVIEEGLLNDEIRGRY